MEKRFLILIPFILLLVSCSDQGIYIDIFSGNYAYSRGEYQDANLLYIKASHRGIYPDYVAYNLGNVYYSLGEAAPALGKWEESSLSKNSDVAFSSLYNKGVLLFELSRYEEAFVSFKEALEINPSDIATKIDLEYCLLKMNLRNESVKPVVEVKKNPADEARKADAMRVLDFVKRIEKQTLKAETAESGSTEELLNDW